MKDGQNKNGNDYRARAEAEKQKRLAALDELLSSSETAASADALSARFPYAEENVLPAPISMTVDILQSNLARKQRQRAKGGSATHSGHRKRLRESARQDVDLYGLSDVELIELLLSFMIPQKDTNVLAHKLIDKFGSVVGVLCAPSHELMNFPSVTKQVATMLPVLSYLCVTHGCTQAKLTSRASAAEFFGLAYLGKAAGTFAAFLDENFRIIVIEKFDCDNVPKREILSSACKYYAKYVFVARRERDLFPQTYNIATAVGDLASMLSDMGAKLLDYLIFTDYGHYTVGAPPKDGGWYPMYIFIPAVKYMRSSDLFGAAVGDPPARLYVGGETAEQLPDVCSQIIAALKCD